MYENDGAGTNLLLDEDEENLADYPPGNVVRAAPTLTVVEGPTDCDTLQASIIDDKKEAQKSNLPHSLKLT